MRYFLILIMALGLTLSIETNATTQEKKKIIDTNFTLVSAYLITMTVFDIEATFAATKNGAKEANPIMKPFIKNSRPATYAIQLGIDTLIFFVAYEMKKSNKSDFKKTWWVLPMIAGTEHGIAGGLNLRYVW